jgi:hypothetical protein
LQTLSAPGGEGEGFDIGVISSCTCTPPVLQYDLTIVSLESVSEASVGLVTTLIVDGVQLWFWSGLLELRKLSRECIKYDD